MSSPNPSVEQLADIAVSTAQLARHLLGVRPRVALLSFSTKGSSRDPSAGKVQAASALAEQKALEAKLDAEFDGDLQVDTALVPEIAARKLPGRQAGRQRQRPDLPRPQRRQHRQQAGAAGLARANAYGHILLGLDRPAADVSRGSSAHDILGVAAIVGVQSVDYQKLYPGRGQEPAGRTGLIGRLGKWLYPVEQRSARRRKMQMLIITILGGFAALRKELFTAGWPRGGSGSR